MHSYIHTNKFTHALIHAYLKHTHIHTEKQVYVDEHTSI